MDHQHRTLFHTSVHHTADILFVFITMKNSSEMGSNADLEQMGEMSEADYGKVGMTRTDESSAPRSVGVVWFLLAFMICGGVIVSGAFLTVMVASEDTDDASTDGAKASTTVYSLHTNSPLSLAGTEGLLHAEMKLKSGPAPTQPRFEWTLEGNVVGDTTVTVSSLPVKRVVVTNTSTLDLTLNIQPTVAGPIEVSVQVFDGDAALTTASATVGYYSIKRDVLMADVLCANFVCSTETTLEMTCTTQAALPASGTYNTINSEKCGAYAKIASIEAGDGFWRVTLNPWQGRSGLEVVADMFEVAALDGHAIQQLSEEEARQARVLEEDNTSDWNGDFTLLDKDLSFTTHGVIGVDFTMKLVLRYRILVVWSSFPYTGSELAEVSTILVGDIRVGAGLQIESLTETKTFTMEFPSKPLVVGILVIPIPHFPDVYIDFGLQAELGASISWMLDGFVRKMGKDLHGEFGPRYTAANGFEMVSTWNQETYTVEEGSFEVSGKAQVTVAPQLHVTFYFRPLFIRLEMGTFVTGPALTATLTGTSAGCVGASLDVDVKVAFENDLPFVAGEYELMSVNVYSGALSYCLGQCMDKTENSLRWVDTDTDTCASYESHSDWCAKYGAKTSASGMSASTACCECGGGNTH